MKKVFVIGLLIIVVLALTACAAGPNEFAAPQSDEAAGFWLGLWHGIIAPVTFIISLFNDNVGVYEVFNNGGWYNFGFLLGASMILGGSGGAGASSRKR